MSVPDNFRNAFRDSPFCGQLVLIGGVLAVAGGLTWALAAAGVLTAAAAADLADPVFLVGTACLVFGVAARKNEAKRRADQAKTLDH